MRRTSPSSATGGAWAQRSPFADSPSCRGFPPARHFIRDACHGIGRNGRTRPEIEDPVRAESPYLLAEALGISQRALSYYLKKFDFD